MSDVQKRCQLLIEYRQREASFNTARKGRIRTQSRTLVLTEHFFTELIGIT